MTVIRVRIRTRRRGADRFWGLCLLALIIYGLALVWQPLAVGAVIVGAACWAAVAIGRTR